MTGVSWMIVGDLELKNFGGYLKESIFPSEVANPLWFVNLLLTPLDKYMYELSKEFYSLSVLNYPSPTPASTPYGGDRGLRGKIWYARGSDKFLVGVSGSFKDAVKIVKFITDFLYKELNLTLNTDKTNITHLRKNHAEFLGYYISVYSWLEGTQTPGSLKGSHREEVINPKLIIPKKVIKEWLIKNGFANQVGKGKYVGKWIYLSDDEIISRFSNILKNLIEYYKLGKNKKNLGECVYIIKYSLLHTIAAKHRMSLNQVLKKYTVDKLNHKLGVKILSHDTD